MAFYMQNQKILLTYTCDVHLNKQEYVNWFLEYICCTSGNKFIPKFLELAHETCPETKTLHTHVLIDFGKRYQTKDARKFDYEDQHPNIRLITTQTHWRNSVEYIAKEDPENAHLKKKEMCLADIVWKQENVSDAVRMCKTVSHVPGMIALYSLKPREIDTPVFIPREWQEQVLNIIETKADERSIYWFYDKIGNTGKTYLGRYLMMRDKDTYIFKCGGNMRDFATIFSNALDSGWTGKVAVFDFPRSASANEIYGPIEAIKDGLVTSTKFSGKTMVINSPHVICFANFVPNIDRLSTDRWNLFSILENRGVPLNLIGARGILETQRTHEQWQGK